MKNRKQKLFTGILVPAATLAVAGSTAAVVLGLKDASKKAEYLNEAKITYSAGDGRIVAGDKETHFEAGTTFDRINQPVVRSNSKNKIFAGWVDENNQPVYGGQKVNGDVKAHAVYNNIGNEYATVTFQNDPTITESTLPVLQGNLSVSVNKGYYFFMVNRPTATWTVIDEQGLTKTKYFKGWKYASTGTMAKEDDKITTNVTLYPVFTEAVTVTWNPAGFRDSSCPEGTGSKERGSLYTTLESGTKFNLFNQPGVKFTVKEGATEKAYFAGWYKKTGTGTSESDFTAMKPDDEITSNITVYAKWSKEPAVDEKYGVLYYQSARSTDVYGKDLPTGMTTSFTPTDSMVVELKTRTWGNTNKPTLVCKNSSGTLNSDYKVDHWEKYNATDDTWEEITDAFTFTEKTNYVRPVLTYAIDSLYIYGSSSLTVETTNEEYGVVILGGASSARSGVSWELVVDDSGNDTQFPEALAKIDEYGRITIGSLTREDFESYNYDHFFVKATSKLNPAIYDYYRVELTMPYVNNTYVWIHTEDSEGSNAKWYYADIDQFCTGESTDLVTRSVTGKSTKTFSSTTKFVDKLVFGTDLAAIPDNFLKGWTNFRGNIDLQNSNIVSIGANFMSGCTNFNNELNLDKIQVIRANFLKDCTSFNQPINIASNSPLVLIGPSFLHGCTNFNSKITLPGTQNLEIENNFMQSCTSFNQNIAIPNIVTYVGAFFMNDCKAFTSKLEVNCPMTGFVYSEGTLSSPDELAAIYATGFQVTGTKADAFTDVYKTSKESPYYRTINDKSFDGKVSAETFTAGIKKLMNATSWTVSDPDIGTIKIVDTNNSALSEDKRYRFTLAEIDPNGVASSKVYVVPTHDTTKSEWTGKSFDKNDDRCSVMNIYDAYGNYTETVSRDWMGVDTGKYCNNNPYDIMRYVRFDMFNFEDTHSINNWTFSDANKCYYSLETGEYTRYKRIVKFDETGDVVFVGKYEDYMNDEGQWADEWWINYSYNISNIDSTTIDKPVDTFKSMTELTYNETNKMFTGTVSTATTSTEKTTFVCNIGTNFAEGSIPSLWDVWLYTGDDPTKNILKLNDYEIKGSYGQRHGYSDDGSESWTSKIDSTGAYNSSTGKFTFDASVEQYNCLFVTFTGAIPAGTKFAMSPASANGLVVSMEDTYTLGDVINSNKVGVSLYYGPESSYWHDYLDYSQSQYTVTDGNGNDVDFSNGLDKGYYINTPGEHTLTFRDAQRKYSVQKTFTVAEGPVSFQNVSWRYLNEQLDKVYAGTMTESEFCALFTTNGKQATKYTDFIGDTKDIYLNNKKYTMRVVDTQHDEIATGETYVGKKAIFTFDSTETYGTSYSTDNETTWAKDGSTSDYNFSTLKQCLDGTPETFAGGKSIKTLLEEDLQNVCLKGAIKKVNKNYIGMVDGAPTSKTYDAKVFTLTYTEMHGTSAGNIKDGLNEGKAYEYYKNIDDGNKVKKCAYSQSVYWLATPSFAFDGYGTDDARATCYTYAQSFTHTWDGYAACTLEHKVAFAFCI